MTATTVALLSAPTPAAGATTGRTITANTATTAGTTTELIARDAFDRLLPRGLGRAQQGGGYHLHYVTPARFTVTRAHRARITMTRGYVSAGLPSARAHDTRVGAAVALSRIPQRGSDSFRTVVFARNAGTSSYRATARVRAGGVIEVQVSRVVRSRTVVLHTTRIHARAHARQTLHLELQVTGTSPVVVAARAWTSGSAPGWQVRSLDSSRGRLTGTGNVALELAQCLRCAPTLVRVSGLRAWNLSAPRAGSGGGTHPGPPVTSPPVTTPPVTTPPVTTPPVTTPPVTTPPTGDAGAAPLGSTSYSIPSGALYVSSVYGNDAAAGTVNAPKRTVAAALKAASSGQTIVLRGGSYHESLFVPDALTGLTIENYPGEQVWFDGSSAVSGFASAGGAWRAKWTTQFAHNEPSGDLLSGYPMAGWPDMVFVDGTPLTQVGSAGAVTSSSFYVDYSSGTLTIGVDPYGHDVRASTLSRALTVSATGLTLRGVGIERYADTLANSGAVYLARSGVRVEDVVVRDVAREGIAMSTANGAVINHVTIQRAGLMGLGSYRTAGLTVENSLITNSDYEHFAKEPTSAGMKLTWSTDIVVRNNTVVDGYDTHGIWLDVSSKRFTIVGNTVTGNGQAPGIEAELSAQGIIANNIARDEAIGVYIFDTSDVQVYNNDLGQNSTGSVYILQDKRRAAPSGYPDPDCTWVVHDIVVSNNRFAYNGGPYGLQVYAFDGATHISASDMDITVNGNMFHARSGSTDSMVAWGGSDDATLTHYDTPAALDAGLGKTWDNAQSDPSQASNAVSSTVAVPLPAPVAAAIGVPTGTRRLGSFME